MSTDRRLINKITLDGPVRTQTKHLQMFSNYVDNCIYICTTVLVAEIFRRLFHCFTEFYFFRKRYFPNRTMQCILERAFKTTVLTKCSIVTLLLVAFLQFGIKRRFPLVPVKFLIYMLLYWIYHAVQFANSDLDYANFVRAPIGLDCGEGMAYSYFHGFLNIIIPSHNADEGICERMQLYEAQHNIKFITRRLVILIPSSMHVEAKINTTLLDRAAPLEIVTKNRAGVLRLFKNDVYRFTEPVNQQFYYIAMEGATPLLTFFESMRSNVTSTSQMIEFQREILLKFYITLKRIIEQSPEIRGKVELIFYNAFKKDGTTQDVGEVLKAHFKNKWKKVHTKYE